MMNGIIIDIPDKLGIGADGPFKFYKVEHLGPLITKGISSAIIMAAFLLLIYLVWSGIEWLTSGGAKESVVSAKARMTAAFIGLMIVLAAWAIYKIALHLFDIPTGVSD
jgi:hypothetical protein